MIICFCMLGGVANCQIGLDDLIYTRFGAPIDSAIAYIKQNFPYSDPKVAPYVILHGDKLNGTKVIVRQRGPKAQYSFLVNKMVNAELEYKYPASATGEFKRVSEMIESYVAAYVKTTGSFGSLNGAVIDSIVDEDCVINNSSKFSIAAPVEKTWLLDSTYYHDSKVLKLTAYLQKRELDENGYKSTECTYILKLSVTNARSTVLYRKYPEYKTIVYSEFSTTGPPEPGDDDKLIPLKHYDDLYYVPVTINKTFQLDFVFDSGATDVSLTPDVVLTLIRAGLIKEADFIGTESFRFADGSVAKSRVFILRSLKIGFREISNVRATVARSVDAPLLLGQSAISKLGILSVNFDKGYIQLGQ